jgi:hypothetical protein
MTDEQYEDLKNNYLEHLKENISELGGLVPHIAVFADHIHKNNKPAMIFMIISEEYMASEDTKDDFIDNKLPDVFKSLKERFVPHAIAWAAEAWVRIVDKDFNMAKQDWKAIPIKKEVVIVSIENKDKTESIIYNIKREGKQVTESGDIVDRIELELSDDLKDGMNAGGRFTGLFRKFKNI